VEANQFFKHSEGTIVTKNQEDILTVHGFKIKLIQASKFLLETGP
jgi:hypothetical protein